MTLRSRADGEEDRHSEAHTCRSGNTGHPYLSRSAESCTYSLRLPSEAILDPLERRPDFARDCRGANYSCGSPLGGTILSITFKPCPFQANLGFAVFHERVPNEACAQILRHENGDADV